MNSKFVESNNDAASENAAPSGRPLLLSRTHRAALHSKSQSNVNATWDYVMVASDKNKRKRPVKLVKTRDSLLASLQRKSKRPSLIEIMICL